MKENLILILVFLSTAAFTQNESNWEAKPKINFTAFADLYYFYDFNNPQFGKRQDFLFNHNRHNEFNLNLALFKVNVEQANYRANIALQSGTYAQDNYAAEEGMLQNVYEANVGIALNAQQNLWLDVGIFPSHMGFESAISTENYTLSRSLAAESSPYFSAGAMLTYDVSDKWQLRTLLLNGWQRIERVQGNSLPSGGTQIVFSPNDKVSLNWSTFVGTDDPDSSRRMRYFSNFFTNFKVGERLAVIAGFDYGLQEEYKNASTYDFWYCPSLIAQYSINNQWKSAIRIEYYEDNDNVIVATPSNYGFKTTGASINFDYLPAEHIQCRLEARWFSSPNELFHANSGYKSESLFIGASMAIKVFGSMNAHK
jgi:hypothetical protein